KELTEEGLRVAKIPGGQALLELVKLIFKPADPAEELIAQAPVPPKPPEAKPEPKPEPKVEPKPEPKAEPKPEPKPDPKPEPKPDPKPDIKPDPNAKPGRLDAETIAGIRKQIAEQQLKKWNFIGGGFAKEPYEEVPAEGAILVGFRYSMKAD